MKKLIPLCLILLLALTPALGLAADRVLRTQGSGSVTIAPDTATLYVGYAYENSDSSEAQQNVADAITAIVAAAQALDVAEDDIVTSTLNTYPVYSYTEDTQVLRGYRVEHMLSITVQNIDAVGEVLDATLKAGANQFNTITYRSSQEKEAYAQALSLAIDEAKAKADAMAISAGVWLSNLGEVNELSAHSVYPYAESVRFASVAGASDASMGSTLMTGDLEITANVELVYEIR